MSDANEFTVVEQRLGHSAILPLASLFEIPQSLEAEAMEVAKDNIALRANSSPNLSS